MTLMYNLQYLFDNNMAARDIRQVIVALKVSGSGNTTLGSSLKHDSLHGYITIALQDAVNRIETKKKLTKMIKAYPKEIEEQMQGLYNRLPEKNKRLYAGIEALKLPYGGITYIAKLFGCSRKTIGQGIKELNEKEILPPNRSRKAGSGRKPVLKKN